MICCRKIDIFAPLSRKSVRTAGNETPDKTYTAMFYIIMTMFIGVGAGYLLRRVKALSHIGKAISLTIYVMLFFLGVKIGTNEQILRNFSTLGLQALLLAVAGAAGSIAASSLVYRLFFKKKEGR